MLTQQEKLNKLKAILEMVDTNLSRSEFVESFKNVLKQIFEIEKKLIAKIDGKTSDATKELENLQKIYQDTIKKIEEENASSLSNLKRWAIKAVNEFFIKSKINSKLAEMDEKIYEVDERMGRIKDGKDGEDADEIKIVNEVLGKIPIQESLTLEQIRDGLEKLKGEERIDVSAIRGLKDELKKMRDEKAGTGMYLFGGNRPIRIEEAGVVKEKTARTINFTGATITRDADGKLNVAVAGGTPVYEEAPTDSGDHLNFTLAHTPATGTFRLFRGGARQQATIDYTLTVAALVITPALATGEILIADYNY